MDLIPGLINDMARECLIRIHPFSIFQSSLSSVSKSWSNEFLHQYHHLRKSSNLTHPITILSQAITPPPSPPSSNPKSPVPLPTYWLTAFDPISSTFTHLPSSPSLPNGLPIFSSLVSYGTTLLILGGWDPITFQVSKSVHIFDFLTGNWRLGSDIPGSDRSLFGCSAGSGFILIAGGHDNEKHALRSVMAYEIQTDKWIPLPDMERERDECTVVYQSGEFHVVSGYSTERQGCFERSAESFNLEKWRWNPVEEEFLGSSNGGGVKCCVVGIDDGEKVYTVQNGVVSVKSNNGDKWRKMVEVERQVLNVQQVVVWKGKVMVIGGCGDGKMSVEVFEMEMGGKWCRVDVPDEFKGHVQSGCVMEL